MGVPAVEGSDLQSTPLKVLRSEKSHHIELHGAGEARPSLIFWGLVPLLVVLTFQILFALEFFAALDLEAQDSFFVAYGIVSILLTLVLIYPFKYLIYRAGRALLRADFNWDHLKVLILLCGLLSVFSQTALDFPGFCRAGIYYSIPLVFAILLVDSVLDAICFENLKQFCGFRFEGILKKVRVLKSTDTVTSAQDSKSERVSGQLLKVKDQLVIGAEEYVPVDCEIVEGVVEVEERKYSALSETYCKGRGQLLYAGSKILKGQVKAVVVNTFGDSHLETTSERLNRAVQHGHNMAWYSSLEKGFQVALIFLAACVALYWQDRGATFPFSIDVAISILLVCGLSKAMRVLPQVAGLALTQAFYMGAMIKSRDVLSRLRKIRGIVLDYSSKFFSGEMSIANFDLVDDRIDEDKMLSAIFSLLGRSSEAFPRAAVRYLRTRVRYLRTRMQEPFLFEVQNYQEYPDQGVLGTIEGVEFSVGSEDYLLERGVRMDVSLLSELNPGEGVVYVAVGVEVVGRFRVSPPSQDEARRTIESLEEHGKQRAALCSMEDSAVVDSAGKSLGLELGRIFGGLSEETYAEKLATFDPALLYSRHKLSDGISKKATVCAMPFDELRFDLEGDIVLFSSDLKVLGQLMRLARRTHKIYYINLLFAAALAGFLILYAFLGLSSPVVVGASLLCFTGFLYVCVSRLTSSQSRSLARIVH